MKRRTFWQWLTDAILYGTAAYATFFISIFKVMNYDACHSGNSCGSIGQAFPFVVLFAGIPAGLALLITGRLINKPLLVRLAYGLLLVLTITQLILAHNLL